MSNETTTGDGDNTMGEIKFVPYDVGSNNKWQVTDNPNDSWTPGLDKLTLELQGHKKALKDVMQERDTLQKELSCAADRRDQAYRDIDVSDAHVARLHSEVEFLRGLLNQMTAIAPTLVTQKPPLMKRP